MELIANLANYYGVLDVPITDFTSVGAFHIYLEQYRHYEDGVYTSKFVIVLNISRANVDEISNDPELEGLKFDYFDEFGAIVVRGNESIPHEVMHANLDNLLKEKVRQSGVSGNEFYDTRSGSYQLNGSNYCPNRQEYIFCKLNKEVYLTKPNMVIEAGLSQSLRSLRAKARDYLTGRISRRRIVSDAESLVDIELETQLGAHNVDFREIIENMDNHRFDTEINLVLLASHNQDCSLYIFEAWARSLTEIDNCLRVGAVQIERWPDEQFAVGILPFGQARDLAVTPAA
jgi:hypothetical protein